MREPKPNDKLPLVTLEQAINENDLVLMDSSIFGNSVITNELHERRNYAELSLELITHETDEINSLFEPLKNPKLITIPEVSQEIEAYYDKVIEAIQFFTDKDRAKRFQKTKKRNRENNKREGWGRKNEKNRKYKEPSSRLFEENQIKKEALEEFRVSLKQLRRLIRDSEIRIKDPRYELLVDMVTLLSKELELKGIKIDYLGEQLGPSDHGYSKTQKNPYDSNVDERLVATAYWTALNGKAPTLLTADEKFPNLMAVTPVLIGADDFMPHNQLFREALTRHSFNLRIGQVQTYDSAITNDTPFFYKAFKLDYVSRSKSNQIKCQIRNMWQEFASLPPSPPLQLAG